MGSNPDLTRETEMLQAARAGDREALGRLLESYRPYLMAVAKRVLADQPPAEWSSVVQAGTATALGRWEQFRGQTPAELLSWLAAVVRNQAFDRRRQQPTGGLNDLIPDSDSTPSRQAEERERAARLIAAVDTLPADYRQIIELRFFEGLRHKQIAARMGRTDEAARSLLTRALRKLREELEETT